MSTVLISDDFNRADSATTLGSTDNYAGGTTATWAISGASSGNWGISSNQAYTPTAFSEARALVTSNADNIRVSTDVVVNGAASTGLVLRYQDGSNYFRLYAIYGQLYLERKTAGSWTTITAPVISGGLSFPCTISAEITGTTIKGFYNGVQQFSVTDSSFQTANTHGMLNHSSTAARLDNFKIEDLSAGSSGTTYSGSGTSNGTASITDTSKQISAAGGTASGSASASSSETVITPSGTTYSGSGTSSGSASLTSQETQISSADGTASGTSSLSSGERFIYAAKGTASGTSSTSGNAALIETASGTAQGTSSVSGSPSVVYPVSGTSSGNSTVTASETVIQASGTTYTGSGTAQGTSAVTGSETVRLSADGAVSGLSNVSGRETIILPASGTADGYAVVIYNDAIPVIGQIQLKGSRTFTIPMKGSRTLTVPLKGSRTLIIPLKGGLPLATENQNFSMYSGETKSLPFTATNTEDGSPINLSGATIKWALKRALNTANAVYKDTTSGITVTDAANGVFTISLIPGDTQSLTGNYIHAAEVTDSSGNVSVVTVGTATITKINL